MMPPSMPVSFPNATTVVYTSTATFNTTPAAASAPPPPERAPLTPEHQGHATNDVLASVQRSLGNLEETVGRLTEVVTESGGDLSAATSDLVGRVEALQLQSAERQTAITALPAATATMTDAQADDMATRLAPLIVQQVHRTTLESMTLGAGGALAHEFDEEWNVSQSSRSPSFSFFSQRH